MGQKQNAECETQNEDRIRRGTIVDHDEPRFKTVIVETDNLKKIDR
jgi:hypothetical protein